MSLLRLYVGAVAALASIGRGAAAVIPRPTVDFLQQRHDPPPTRRGERLHRNLAWRSVTAAKGYFLKRDEAGPRWRAYRKPHSAPFFLAHCRDRLGRERKVQCETGVQAADLDPFMIEKVNGFGQVSKRWRIAEDTPRPLSLQAAEPLITPLATQP